MERCFHDFYYRAHHLIKIEELKKDGKKKVFCWCCYQPIWGSLYNCVECGNRPVHMYNPIQHCLEFTKKLELNDGNNKGVCWRCDKPVLGSAYTCFVSECGFVIHTSCIQQFKSHQINHPLHPDHTLSLQRRDSNRCDACCRSHNSSSFYKCDSCNFQLDVECANHFPINPNDCHRHEFSPIWKQIQFNCEACGEEITNFAYRVCNICKLLVHDRCAKFPRTLKIKPHNHLLKLIYSPHEIKKRPNMMFCRICYDKVSTEYAAYYCQKCSYVVHLQCVERYKDIYKEESPGTSESVPNEATHLIKALSQSEDGGPHPQEIQHFSHQKHKLIICNIDEISDDKLCQGCMEFIIKAPFYNCAECNFFLHTRCAKLPTRILQYQLDNFHNLTLLPKASTKSGGFFCDICSRHHRGFTYKCDSCWKHIGVQCGSIPEILKHQGHRHPLRFALNSQRKCNACSKDKENSVFVCTSCDFALGIRCANLPLIARHTYDTHLLKLTSAIENDSG
ncbi:uncharacterized protein LOC133853752 [Alnus glutinosa]|uniref:uncharacterized protein LOC133853752 n=1 Tax=Alnus glutinosa TaxID=3517 RepID=UPI002D776C2D|nr:uncharacterized protein LOC133853752 [Alnus glutinosa]